MTPLRPTPCLLYRSHHTKSQNNPTNTNQGIPRGGFFLFSHCLLDELELNGLIDCIPYTICTVFFFQCRKKIRRSTKTKKSIKKRKKRKRKKKKKKKKEKEEKALIKNALLYFFLLIMANVHRTRSCLRSHRVKN